MKRKKALALVLTAVLCLTLSVSAFASAEIPDASRGIPAVRYLNDIRSQDGGPASGEASEESTLELTLDAGVLQALGIEMSLEDGTLTVSLGGLLELLGARVSYDEASGTLTVTDESGVIGALLGLLAD